MAVQLMGIRPRILIFIAVFMIGIAALAGCAQSQPPTSQVQSPTLPQTTPSIPPQSSANPQPVEIVSVKGPLAPINPGGPVVEITVKNVSREPIISLAAAVQLGRSYTFNFNPAVSNPLLPDQSSSAKMTLIGGSLNTDVVYPFVISGILQNGTTFSYTLQAQIVKQ
jgi:hypothetical protein